MIIPKINLWENLKQLSKDPSTRICNVLLNINIIYCKLLRISEFAGIVVK